MCQFTIGTWANPRPGKEDTVELRLTGAMLDANGLNDWWREALPIDIELPTPDQTPDTEDTDDDPTSDE